MTSKRPPSSLPPSDNDARGPVRSTRPTAQIKRRAAPASGLSAVRKALVNSLFALMALAVTGVLALALLLGLTLAMAYPNLPDLEVLTDYRPKIPLRVYTADGALIGEFGEERRNLVRISQVPDVLKSAILAAEDDRFYQHGGVDYLGVLRAGLANLTSGGKTQGASTITMQVARNFFLSSEKSWTRKIYEVLLAFKIEASLSKNEILDLYINQIYLGQRAYGFASAAQIYYGKRLDELTAADAAMLAGLPKAPSAYNPIVNPKRARSRQHYVLSRMHGLGYLTDAEFKQALDQPLHVRALGEEFPLHAEYVAEIARQLMYETFKEDTYSRGISVYTTIRKADQLAAYQAVRRGVLEYERRHGWNGPEAFVSLPGNGVPDTDTIEDALSDHPDSDDLLSAIVLSAEPQRVLAVRAGGEVVEIRGEGLRFAASGLSAKAQPARRLRRGAIIRILHNEKSNWEILHLPTVESAFVAADHHTGAITAMVGGFDFSRSKFNHVTQAWRQPGSSFKPFIYSAALEKGFTPATTVEDAPFRLDEAQTGGQAWEPKNYDGRYEGSMRLSQALAKSKNMVSIRILQAIGPKYAQDYVSRFGFAPEKHPAYLTMALGAGSVTPYQMLAAYGVFANGGFRVTPFIIGRVLDNQRQVLMQAHPVDITQSSNRVIDSRNAFVMDTMLRGVVRYGTGARAMQLKRGDLAGKTGTTNDSKDAWFAGYSSTLVGISWLGFDQPKSLGDKETGGGGALPIWMGYMGPAMRGVPEKQRVMPEGMEVINGDYYYSEFTPGLSIRNLGGPKTDDSENSSEDSSLTPGGETPAPGADNVGINSAGKPF